VPQFVRRRRRTCEPRVIVSIDIQRLLTSFWELTMISRFHVYRYSNCMLLYNISTLHHRDDRSFPLINFNDASLVGLPAPFHRSLQGTRVRLCPCTKQTIIVVAAESVGELMIVAEFKMSHRCFAIARPALPPDNDDQRSPQAHGVSCRPCTDERSRWRFRESLKTIVTDAQPCFR